MYSGSSPCPHCGASLPEEASFCHRCARSIRPRETVVIPDCTRRKRARMAVRLVCLVLSAAVCVLLGAALYRAVIPQVYDAYGEIIYTDGADSYRLFLTFQDNTSVPQREYTVQTEQNMTYQRASSLFVSHVESGHNVGRMFLQQVETVYTQLIQPEDSLSPMICSQPMYQAYDPDVTLLTTVDLSGRSSPAELVWIFVMKNGDTIRLRQKLYLEQVSTLNCYPEDYPMATIEELQALVDYIAAEVPMDTMVYLHLPPVHYQGGLTVHGRTVSLYGSVDEKNMRTAFTGPVVIVPERNPLGFIRNIEFRGGGSSGVGLTISADYRLEDCLFSGWDTGLLIAGQGWCDPVGCLFEDNAVGFRFDSAGEYSGYTSFEYNTFRNNGTAMVLERIPDSRTINLIGSRFTGNQVDIENLCDHPLDIANAIFE